MQTRHSAEERSEAAKIAALKIREYYKAKFRCDLPLEMNGYLIANEINDMFQGEDIYHKAYLYSDTMKELLLFLKESKGSGVYDKYRLGNADEYIQQFQEFFETLQHEECAQVELDYYCMMYEYGGVDTVEEIVRIGLDYEIKLKAYLYEQELKTQLYSMPLQQRA